jgi:hypothetical protein
MDVFSIMELGIWLGFVKTLELRGEGVEPSPPLDTPLTEYVHIISILL